MNKGSTLQLTPLTNAIQRLAEGWARYEQDISDTQIRDGLIQRFEFAYELSHKTLKYYLESVSANPKRHDEMPFAEIIRSANEQNLLLGDWSNWRNYRDMRSKTSHAYDEKIAISVVKGIPAFLAEAAHLLQRLQENVKD